MTAPAPLSGGDTRTQLAEALRHLLASDDATMYYDAPHAVWNAGDRYADALLPVVERIADERAAEALRPFEDLFSGGPDTACRTTWREAPIEERAEGIPPAECVEVPMDDLRDAFTRAASLRAASREETGL